MYPVNLLGQQIGLITRIINICIIISRKSIKGLKILMLDHIIQNLLPIIESDPLKHKCIGYFLYPVFNWYVAKYIIYCDISVRNPNILKLY